MGYEPVFSYINWEEKKELVESGDIDCVWGSFTIDGYRICVIIPEENTRRPAMSTSASDIMVKMIQFSNGNRHDINHFMKVYTYAKTIAESENVSEKDLITVETAAIVHDIACPLCREKYGNTNGKYQEKEGILLAEEFLKDTDLPEEIKKRVAFLVGHHHTLTGIDGIDYQILLEADYLVNADESGYSEGNISNTKRKLFKTKTGLRLLEAVYGI